MTLPSSGQLDMNWINAEFGRGHNLNAYRNTLWYTDGWGSGYFPGGQIAFSDFWGKRSSPPWPYVTATSYTGDAAGASGSDLSWAHSCPGGTTCLVVFSHYQDSNAPTVGNSAYYNGIGMTRQVSQQISNNHIVQCYVLFNPPIGTYTVTTDYLGSIDRFIAGSAISLANARWVSGQNTYGVANGSASSLNTDVYASAGCIILGAAQAQRSGTSAIPAMTPTSPSGATQFASSWNTSNSLGKKSLNFYSAPLGAGTYSVSCSITNASYNTRSIMGIAFSP